MLHFLGIYIIVQVNHRKQLQKEINKNTETGHLVKLILISFLGRKIESTKKEASKK